MPAEMQAKLGACKRCHERKARCDKIRPACNSCLKAGKQCSYPPRENPPRRQDVDRLEQRLKQVEFENASLLQELQNVREKHSHGGPDSHRTVSSIENEMSPPQNEVASQVSYLSLSAGGERQFLGPASGLLLANLLQANVSTTPISGPSQGRDSRWQGGKRRNEAALPGDFALPPKNLTESLLAAYCDHDHLCYPFLDTRSLHATIDAIYSDDSFASTHPVDCFFVDIICAIGTAYVYKFDWQVLPDAETHYNRAMNRFNVVLSKGGLAALQAIIAVCQYRMGSSSFDTSASLWLLIGIAARMAFELGLHKEAIYVRNSNDEEVHDEVLDVKRRCFWCVVAMDRVASCTLGRPLAIHLEDVDTELPQFSILENVGFDSSTLSTEPRGGPQMQLRMAIFVHILRYRLICGDILRYLHTGLKKRDADTAGIRKGLTDSLGAWRQDISLLPLSSASLETSMGEEMSSFRAREWYELLYHNGILMLFRPSPALSDVSQNSDTLQHLFHSARESMHVYASLHRSRRINYSWVTLHAVFIAGLSYIYALRCHFQNLRRPPDEQNSCGLAVTPTITQVVNDTRACSNVLVAVSERWSTARGCSQVFERLTDAVLSDVVETQTRGPLLPNQASSSNIYASGAIMQQSAIPLDQTMRFGNMAVDSTLQDCFPDLRTLCGDQYGNDAIYQLSQDWMFGIPEYSGAY